MYLMSMSGYTKLFNSILASTIWREDDKTRIVWITLLAMANKNGIAEGSVPGLADLARVSIEECKKALVKLTSPDEYSRTVEHEGRRIEVVDGGWFIINHPKYRAKMNADERRDYNRLKQREHRQKKASTRRQTKSMTVNDCNQTSALSAHTEAAPKAKALDDAALLESLKSNRAYEGIEVEVEFGKAQAWCLVKGRKLTKAFFVNWLNRIDRPMKPINGANGHSKTKTAAEYQIEMDRLQAEADAKYADR